MDDLRTTARNAVAKYLGLERAEAAAIVAQLDLGHAARIAKVATMPEAARADHLRLVLGRFAPQPLDGTTSEPSRQPSGLRLACCCCTYHRPQLLGAMIACYLAQDYPAELRELLILDDAGQYDHLAGGGWQLVSIPRRFRTLGEKRNAAAALADPRADVLVVWDDDDLYQPWALSAIAAAAAEAPLVRPSKVLRERSGVLLSCGSGGLFHGSWAYSRELFDRVGGYRPINNGEDQELLRRLCGTGAKTADPIALGFRPYYVYRDATGSYHLSWIPGNGYDKVGHRGPANHKTLLEIALPYDLAAAPIEDAP